MATLRLFLAPSAFIKVQGSEQSKIFDDARERLEKCYIHSVSRTSKTVRIVVTSRPKPGDRLGALYLQAKLLREGENVQISNRRHCRLAIQQCLGRLQKKSVFIMAEEENIRI